MILKNVSWFNKIKNQLFCAIQLTTKKIIVIAFFITLTIIISLGKINYPIMPVLEIDLGVAIILLAIFAVGFIYTFLIATVTPWMKIIAGNINMIGELAYMMSSWTAVISLAFLYWVFSLLFLQNNSNNKFSFVADVSIAICTILVTALASVYYNYAFILDMYNISTLKSQLWTIFFPFNIIKFSLNLSLFLFLKPKVMRIFYHFNI